jgi:hypothetical protein
MKLGLHAGFGCNREPSMKLVSRKILPTYCDVGWPVPGEAVSAFSELKLPDATLRLLDRRVHLKALDEAGRTLKDLLRQSGGWNSR